MSSTDEEDLYEEEEETRLLNAEEVTLIATNFLRRLGTKRGIKPIKASLHGETYVVEIGMKKKTAAVQIDATNEEVKEYEIKAKAKESPSSFSLTPKSILLVCGIVVVSIFVSSLLGIQSFFPSLL